MYNRYTLLIYKRSHKQEDRWTVNHSDLDQIRSFTKRLASPRFWKASIVTCFYGKLSTRRRLSSTENSVGWYMSLDLNFWSYTGLCIATSGITFLHFVDIVHVNAVLLLLIWLWANHTCIAFQSSVALKSLRMFHVLLSFIRKLNKVTNRKENISLPLQRTLICIFCFIMALRLNPPVRQRSTEGHAMSGRTGTTRYDENEG